MRCEKCKDKRTIAYGRIDPFGRIKITSMRPCPSCTKPCTDCNGRGGHLPYEPGLFNFSCNTCGGTGSIPQGEDVPPIPNAALSSAQQQR